MLVNSSQASSALPQVAFDEAGQTGANLLDVEQPVFCLASIHVTATDASQVLAHGDQREFHYTRAVRSAGGRRRILEILNSGIFSAENVSYGCADKSFMLTSKLVSQLIEPILANGDVFIENDRTAYKMACYLHQHLDEYSEVREAREALQSALRGGDPTLEQLRNASIGLRATTAPEPLAWYMHLLADCGLELIANRPLLIQEPPKDAPPLNPSFPLFFSLANHWSRRLGPFRLIHDQQHEVERWAHDLAKTVGNARNVEIPSQVGEPLSLPIQIDGVEFVVSHDDVRVQLADLVAGAAAAADRAYLGLSLSDEDRAWGMKLREKSPIDAWELDRIAAF